MNFRYVAYDRSGQRRAGEHEADTAAHAREQLGDKGFYVLELGPADQHHAGRQGGAAGSTSRSALAGALGGKRRVAHLVDFARQLAILVATGTPIAEGLAAIGRQTRDDAWKDTIGELRRHVEQGATLAEAMSRLPRAFDPVSCALVAAGEASGRLDTMLGRLAAIARQQQAVGNAVTGAMVYPIILTTLSVAVIIVMLLVVVPRFETMFAALNAPLPATTELLLAISGLIRERWYAVLPAAAAPVAAAVFWLLTPAAKPALDRAAVSAPIFGKLVRSLAAARMTRLLGVLLDAKMPLLDALELVSPAMSNTLYRRLIDTARDNVVAGEPLSAAFVNSPLVTPSLAEAIRSAEQSARLGEVLSGLADHMDEDNSVAVKSVATLVEPVILVVMGAVVATVAASMFLPLFDLTASAGGGVG